MDKVKMKSDSQEQQPDKEIDNTGTETPLMHEAIKVNEAHIKIITKEFDLDRFQAIRVLRKNEGNIQKTMKYLIEN